MEHISREVALIVERAQRGGVRCDTLLHTKQPDAKCYERHTRVGRIPEGVRIHRLVSSWSLFCIFFFVAKKVHWNSNSAFILIKRFVSKLCQIWRASILIILKIGFVQQKITFQNRAFYLHNLQDVVANHPLFFLSFPVSTCWRTWKHAATFSSRATL